MIKRFLSISAFALALMMPVSAFADASVVSSSGSPRARTSNGQWINLTPGASIPNNATVVTSPSDRLVLNVGGRSVTVPGGTNTLVSRLGGSSASSQVASRVASGVSTRVSVAAGVRAERSDQYDAFRHFRRPGQSATAASSSPQDQLNEAQRYFNMGDFNSARNIAKAITGGSEDTQSRAKFLAALSAYSLFDYSASAGEFESVWESLADAQMSEQALLLAGMSWFNMGNNQEANRVFYSFLDRFPNSPSRPAAMYQIAISFVEMNDPNKAREAFNYIITTFPNDPMAQASRQDLTTLQN
jgi:TolA-binding protein